MQSPEEYEITLKVMKTLNAFKKSRGYTKKRVCELLGIGVTTLDDYKNGVSSFRLGTLIKIAQVCRVSVNDLLDGTSSFASQINKVDEDNQSKNESSAEQEEVKKTP